MHNVLKNIRRIAAWAGMALCVLIQRPVCAQTTDEGLVSKLRLEARADVEAMTTQPVSYGLHGRYFNLIAGGNLGHGFSYYLRQGIKANAGSINFFDNTDFLYFDYRPSSRWRLRFGKDAYAVGGFEYDTPPIDEHLTSEYWNNIYCFQLGGSVAYTLPDDRNTFTAQVSQSPYINSLGLDWDEGLLSYHVQWNGKLGEHWQTLWSTSLMERQRGVMMNLTMIGTRVAYDNWSLYVDLMHHALTWEDWGHNYGVVARMDWRLTSQLTIVAKGSRETNESPLDLQTVEWIDQLVPAGHTFTKGLLGLEYRPYGMESVRLHGYVAMLSDKNNSSSTTRSVAVNIGATWGMNFAKLLNKR